jgi:SAM-dependent methyltransferase
VITEHRGDVRLHPDFARALACRDLLEAKLDFAGFTINDFADLFTDLVREPAGFMQRSRLFQLFDYRRALEPSIENYERTRAWMRLTSTLTRYEAQAAMELHDFSGYRRALDVGGNSGELLVQLCRRHPSLHGTVLDLPLVCEIGLEHVLGEPESSRIRFQKADVRSDPLPGGHDLILFKSMLHDWPPSEAERFLARAAHALEPGGSIVIFERGPLCVAATPGFGLLPILLFFRSYRGPQAYAAQLQTLGLTCEVREIQLDTPFFLLAASKQPAR